MVGKKGFLRVVEAMMAVLIILGALLIISPNEEKIKREDLTDVLRSLLDEIAKNQELREEIANYNLSQNRSSNKNKQILDHVRIFLEQNIKNPLFNYSISICKIDKDPCVLTNYPNYDIDIYSAERLITASVMQDEPPSIRKIKVFLWRRL